AEAKNQKVLILPLEATSVIGAIAGVSEIAREAFGGGGDAASPAQPVQTKAPAGQRPRAGGSVPSVSQAKRRSMESILALGAWNWMIRGALLFVLEVMSPGIFLMWFGVPAAATALIVFRYDLAWQWQLIWVLRLLLVFVVV